MNAGRTVFAQVMELLPRRAFDLAVGKHGAGRAGSLSAMDQLLAMVFAQLAGRSSLRETAVCLKALGSRRYHCGLRRTPSRASLSRANERRDYRIFADTALSMIASARLALPVDPDLRRLNIRAAYALDATTIDLCLALFPWAKFKLSKGAVKAHTMIDLRVGIPVFLRVTHARASDSAVLDELAIQLGAYYMLDRGYVDFKRLYRIELARAFFVTRTKKGIKMRLSRRLPVTPGGPVLADDLVRLTSPPSRRRYPRKLRRIRYRDPETGKRLTFLTNHHNLGAQTVALLYRKRWRIELFFKWIKQHLHVKAFFGQSSNAVQIQLWIAVIVYVLIHRLKQLHGLKHTPSQIVQVLSVTLFEKTPIKQLFSETGNESDTGENPKQLSLFDLK